MTIRASGGPSKQLGGHSKNVGGPSKSLGGNSKAPLTRSAGATLRGANSPMPFSHSRRASLRCSTKPPSRRGRRKDCQPTQSAARSTPVAPRPARSRCPVLRQRCCRRRSFCCWHLPRPSTAAVLRLALRRCRTHQPRICTGCSTTSSSALLIQRRSGRSRTTATCWPKRPDSPIPLLASAPIARMAARSTSFSTC